MIGCPDHDPFPERCDLQIGCRDGGVVIDVMKGRRVRYRIIGRRDDGLMEGCREVWD